MRVALTIRKLREFHSPEELASIYATRYDHTRWPDHIERVHQTRAFIRDFTRMLFFNDSRTFTVADLSCGDAAIATTIGASEIYLGDYVAGYAYHGRIEDTIEQIPHVDLFILSETLEHVENPAGLLRQIHDKADAIVVTTPLDERDAGNPEHYWGWDFDGIREVFADTPWTPYVYTAFTPSMPNPYYTYQMWGAHSDSDRWRSYPLYPATPNVAPAVD